MSAELIHIVDDDHSIRQLLDHALRVAWGYDSALFSNASEFLEHLDDGPDLVILDIMMDGMDGVQTLSQLRQEHPDLPVIILSSQQRIEVAIETMRLGAHDYFTKPVDLRRLEYSIRSALQLSRLRGRVQTLQDSLEQSVHFENIVSSSGRMHEALRLVDKARNSDITVLIEGESGTGKEMIARAIHFNGKRKSQPFVVVNCAAIPKDLLESELFGHEKGAFTGAVQRKMGKFEQAQTGSIFLDEIGELDVSLQAKFLRVLQQKQLERVGGEETIDLDVRVISATNRDLHAMAGTGDFREDLYFRLSTFPILLPPLRERSEDIALLSDHFLRRFAKEESKVGLAFAEETFERILSYAWPGNVRELMSAIQRAVLLADGPQIRVQDLPAAVQAAPRHRTTLSSTTTSTGAAAAILHAEGEDEIVPLERLKELAIREALNITGGHLAETARRLGIGRTTLYNLIRKYSIEHD